LTEETKTEKLFTRERLMSDEQFADYRDIVEAVMPKDARWSVKALNKKITAFLSRKTN